jgi:His-Xaa-Ser system protein HxsD
VTDAGDVLAAIGTGSITLSLDPAVYPLSVIHGTAYLFLPRAYVRLDRSGARIAVRLAGKTKLDRAALEALAGEFANELTNQFVREDVAQKTTRLREQVVGRALLGALGTGDELSGFGAALGGDPAAGSGDADAAADPLGIAVDWEVRFGKPATKDRPREKLHADDPGPAAGEAELRERKAKP